MASAASTRAAAAARLLKLSSRQPCSEESGASCAIHPSLDADYLPCSFEQAIVTIRSRFVVDARSNVTVMQIRTDAAEPVALNFGRLLPGVLLIFFERTNALKTNLTYLADAWRWRCQNPLDLSPTGLVASAATRMASAFVCPGKSTVAGEAGYQKRWLPRRKSKTHGLARNDRSRRSIDKNLPI
jgi:hypothetical protein